MWSDPIVEEVRTVRHAHAKRFNYDLQAIAADLKKQQKTSRKKFITLQPKKPVILPKAKANRQT